MYATCAKHASGPSNKEPKCSQNVALFWDFENLAIPAKGQAAHKRITSLIQLTKTYGESYTIRAYLDPDLYSSSRCRKLLQKLREFGVDLVSCPHEGKKEVVDSMIHGDMEKFANSSSGRATVILVSADSGYKERMSELSRHGLNVVLIAPKQIHAGSWSTTPISVRLNWPNLAPVNL
ncbi:hypothetical protein WOLCODRAFT_77287 [Wolfiporia cocos MD-104 SS10]|uniref:NYN domain-containing protein n=1 Tax=Wolfiporia cocos (strain MD-104) TaxID=742152 RepID=A0A2H3JPR9_WOLCO|nr:hypothetical protein WOLCODRAFT_77287 [Wolfiporia cocos MD-104 SS10]